jgi:ORF6N domain
VATTFPPERIERSILLIRGHKVLLDVHLAALYGVTTKRLNEQVRRNRARFPEDFMFQLTADEIASLRSQFATSNNGRSASWSRKDPHATAEPSVSSFRRFENSRNVEVSPTFFEIRLTA